MADLETKGFSPLAYRYLCLTAHYRAPLDFSLESLENSQHSINRLKNIIVKIKDDGKRNKKYLQKFEKAINNDLDTPKALAVLWNLVRDTEAAGKRKTIEEMDKIFGLDLLNEEAVKTPKEIKVLAEEREKARQQKDWQKADQLRQRIKELGYKVEDTAEGPIIKKI